MGFVALTATIHKLKCGAVEKRLQEIGVPGMSVSETRGFGDYKNFFQSDWMGAYARLLVYVPQEEVERIAEAIMDVAHTGLDSDGVIAISPITRLFRISDKTEITAD
ncbi:MULTISPECIES: P-II family nitrogen regulator [Kordiimonas]|jgi:nitrogen regulatory protein P-II 1|uniref:P-II family nitrogen regulator n=1 Tax=Kordiimonas TaxID=288021 RepID=UPI00257D61F3|nr:P-II family nitrogen regulator [Kordiimonas sp. UBA4487]